MITERKKQAEERQTSAQDVRLSPQKTCVKHILDHVPGCVLGTKLGKRTQR